MFAGKKLKGEEINLKILGDGMIFLGMIRKSEIRRADFEEYLSNSNEFVDIPGEEILNCDCRLRITELRLNG